MFGWTLYRTENSLERNEKAGIIYHRDGINGDYDDVEKLIHFIQTGER